jgi:hypothetical protein
MTKLVQNNGAYNLDLGLSACVSHAHPRRWIIVSIPFFYLSFFVLFSYFLIFALFSCLGSCLICTNGIYVGRQRVWEERLFPQVGTTLVSIEINMNTRTVHYFVNNKQIPHCVTKLPPSVYFAVCERPLILYP